MSLNFFESSRQGKYSILSFGVKSSLNQRFRGRSFKKNHYSGEPVQDRRKRMQKRKKASKGTVLDEAPDVDRSLKEFWAGRKVHLRAHSTTGCRWCVCVYSCVCSCHVEGLLLTPWLSIGERQCNDQEQTSKHGKCENGSLRMIDKTRKRNLRDSRWDIKSETVFPVGQNTRYNSQNLERPLCWLSKSMSTTVAIPCIAMYTRKETFCSTNLSISTSELYSTKPPNPGLAQPATNADKVTKRSNTVCFTS